MGRFQFSSLEQKYDMTLTISLPAVVTLIHTIHTQTLSKWTNYFFEGSGTNMRMCIYYSSGHRCNMFKISLLFSVNVELLCEVYACRRAVI